MENRGDTIRVRGFKFTNEMLELTESSVLRFIIVIVEIAGPDGVSAAENTNAFQSRNPDHRLIDVGPDELVLVSISWLGEAAGHPDASGTCIRPVGRVRREEEAVTAASLPSARAFATTHHDGR